MMPNISQMVILKTIYNGEVFYSTKIKKALEKKGYIISDGLLSTTLKYLLQKGYIKIEQKYDKQRKSLRSKSAITEEGKEFYKQLENSYLEEVEKINRAIEYNAHGN